MYDLQIKDRTINDNSPTFLIAEIGINHGGKLDVAKLMVESAHRAGAEVIKHQTHIAHEEMSESARLIQPINADSSIYDVIENSCLTLDEEVELKTFVENLGMLYISTPFSRAAADFLMEINVPAFKIGSGECNNYPLIEHIAAFGKPIILSTGMNDIGSIKPAVDLIKSARVPYALLHCVNLYPSPANTLNLGAIGHLKNVFPDAQVGFSDHSVGNFASFAAVALGANIIERHYTDSLKRAGPDIECSIDERGLGDLIKGCNVVQQARGGSKQLIPEEEPTRQFAYASVVATRTIQIGESLSRNNIWVKRPGTGEIPAKRYWDLIGKTATQTINADKQLEESDYA